MRRHALQKSPGDEGMKSAGEATEVRAVLSRGDDCANDDGGATADPALSLKDAVGAGEQAIRILAATRRYNPTLNPTPSEKLVRNVERRAFIGAGVSVAVVVLPVLISWVLGWSIAAPMREAGVLTLYVSVGCVVVFLFVDPVFFFLRVGSKMDEPGHHSLGSFRHEQAVVHELAAFSAEALASVDHWLVTRVTGIESRVGVVFGEKFSVLALLAFLITAGRSLLDMHTTGPSLAFGWAWAFVAGFAGMAILGGVALRVISTSYAYQRQLLGEAIRLRTEADASECAAPP